MSSKPATPGRKRPHHIHRTGECFFPDCEDPAVTDSGMCEQHRRVAMSTTGSWLEAG